MKPVFFAILLFSGVAMADDLADMQDRDPAAVNVTSAARRNYPGGGDQEDLQVQAKLPEAAVKVFPRDVQRGVYKNLYNQELKDSSTEAVEE